MSEHTESFEIYMSAGVQANNAGQHVEALEMRFAAYQAADGDIEAGRAARDIGHSFAELGDDGTYYADGGLSNGTISPQNPTLAEAYADHAVWLHRRALEAELPGAEREYWASAGYAGVMALKRAIASEKAGELDEGAVDDARQYLTEATAGPADDQYTINFAGRYATLISLYEDAEAGRGRAIEAWRLARHSEAPGLPHSNPNLSASERRKAQNLARARAAGAYVMSLPGVSAASIRRGHTSKLRRLALGLAERLI
jgi:hypothetical protein